MLISLLYAFEGSEAAFHVIGAAATPFGGRRGCHWHRKVPGAFPRPQPIMTIADVSYDQACCFPS